MTRRAVVTQAAVARALKGAAIAGLPVASFEVDPNTGKISVKVAAIDGEADAPARPNEWDKALGK